MRKACDDRHSSLVAVLEVCDCVQARLEEERAGGAEAPKARDEHESSKRQSQQSLCASQYIPVRDNLC